MGFRFLPYKKAKKGVQIAGVDYDDSGGGGGGGDTSTLANKTDLTAIILTGTTNTSGDTITAGTWFYLNGVLVKAKADIANGATFTKDTNYEEKTVGDELTELNSNIGGSSPLSISSRGVTNTTNFETTGHTYGALADAVRAKYGTDTRTFKFGEAYEISQYSGAPQGAVVLYNVYNYNYQEVWVFYINRIYVRFQYANPDYSVVEYSLLG